MDIEGYETKALQGFSDVYSLDILVVESHNNLDIVLFLLQMKGYTSQNIQVIPIDGVQSMAHAGKRQVTFKSQKSDV